MLPLTTRFPEEKPPPPSLYDTFRSHHRPRSGWKVDYEK
jgi:hypothetical protein